MENAEQKTVIEWLQQAKADGYEWAQSAIEQCSKKSKRIVIKLSDAVYFGFSWVESKEGSQYWNTIHDKLCELGL